MNIHTPFSIPHSQHPYSEENFAELIFAVKLVKVEGRGAKPEYMRVVNSYFSQLIDKLNNEETYTLTAEVGDLRNPCMIAYVIVMVTTDLSWKTTQFRGRGCGFPR